MASLSVIVPAHDDESTIASALASVEQAVAYLKRQPGHEDDQAEAIAGRKRGRS